MGLCTPSPNDLLARIVAKALRKFPYMNARLAPDAIELLGHVNMGMAVDTERGLLVPVIRDADGKSLRQFGQDFRELADRARKGRSLPDNLTGGSFTITSLGTFDVDAFTPVITTCPRLRSWALGASSPSGSTSPSRRPRRCCGRCGRSAWCSTIAWWMARRPRSSCSISRG